jgi:hypothetical protein
LPKDALNVLETIRRWNDEEHHSGPPAAETGLTQELVELGLVERVTRPVVNQPGVEAVVGHEIAEKGRKLLSGEEV